jgi:hypothetical protein
MMRYMVENDRMPPWFAAPHVGTFANDCRLAPEDKQALLDWVDAGAREGRQAWAPEPRTWASGWQIGEPDAVVQLEEPFAVPAEGVVDYQYMYVKTNFDEDKWVERLEIRPTAPQVVHHVLVLIEEPGRNAPQDAAPGEPVFDGGLQGYFAVTVPGYPGQEYPQGAAKLLPKGAWLKFQLHYTPNGKPALDQTKIGFVFTDGPPERIVATNSAFNTRLDIPPGADNYEASGDYPFERPGVLVNFFPHMHLRGKAFRYELIHPDGRSEVLLDVPRYDFNWQLYYALAEPRAVEAGTKLRATGWFDNSERNPFNPDPTKRVHFGEQTFDEMMIGYFDWIPSRNTGLADGGS